MRVKTAEFKANLSKFLRRVRDQHEILIICDRDEPVAVISPVHGRVSWRQRREVEQEAMAQRGLVLTCPPREPDRPLASLVPERAADGRTDVRTIELVRGGRDY